MMTTYTFPWSATNDHLIAIGKIAIEASCLEQTIQLATWQILGLPEEKASYITGKMHLDGRIILFEDVARSYFPESSLAELEDIVKDIRQARTQRNHIIHGLWEHGKPEASSSARVYRYKREKGVFRLRHKNYTAPQIEAVAKQISDALIRFTHFLNKHGVSPPDAPRITSTPY